MNGIVSSNKDLLRIFFASLVCAVILAANAAFSQSASDIAVPSLESQIRKDLEEEYRLLNEEMKLSTEQFKRVTADIQELSQNVTSLTSDVETLRGWVGGFAELIDECEDNQANLFEQYANSASQIVVQNYEEILKRCRIRVERQMARVASIRAGIAEAIEQEQEYSATLSALEPVLELLNEEQNSLRVEIQFLNDRLYGQTPRVEDLTSGEEVVDEGLD